MVKRALTINHSDTTCRSGIQQDLQIFQANGVFGFSVMTYLTTNGNIFSNTSQQISDNVIKEQLESVFSDGHIDGIKISHLKTKDSVSIIKKFIDHYQVQTILLELTLEELESNLYDPLFLSTQYLLLRTTDSLETTTKYLKELSARIHPTILLMSEQYSFNSVGYHQGVEKKLMVTDFDSAATLLSTLIKDK